MIVHVPIEHSVVQSPSDIYKIMQMVLESEHETDRNKEHFWTLAMNETKNIFNGEDGPMARLLLIYHGRLCRVRESPDQRATKRRNYIGQKERDLPRKKARVVFKPNI